MKTNEQISKLKQYPITDFLRGEGISPVSRNGQNFIYSSPLRQDSKPSFSVNPIKNVFNDFGNESDKGGVIDLVMKYKKISFPDACDLIVALDGKEKNSSENPPFFSCRPSPTNSSLSGAEYEITSIGDLQHQALIRYAESRKISFQTAFTFLREIHYNNAKGRFFGVGYQTDNGSYVVRNEKMKNPINLGKASIKTIIVPNSKCVLIFEGMFDFLSAVECFKRPPIHSTIILNSVSNLSQAMPLIMKHQKIFAYLDNDEAGRKALEKLRVTKLEVIDQSDLYRPFNDFNDYLKARK
jgi:Toprim-like/CHC2 zinc finger